MSEDSDKDTGKSTDSSKEENTLLKEEVDKNDETEDSSSSTSFLTGFKEFLHRTSQVDSGSDADDHSKSKTESQVADVKTEVTETESHEDSHEDYFPLKEHLMKYNGFRTFISKKALIMQVIAILAGVFLIIYGLINSFVSVDKVADNVVFGERAMISVFFIFIGILILAAAFAQKLLSSSFLNKIHSELEVAEGRRKAPESDSDDSNTKETSDNSGKMQGKDNVDVKDNADIKNADIKSNMDKEDKN